MTIGGSPLGGEMRRNIAGEFSHRDSPFFTGSGSPLVWIFGSRRKLSSRELF